MVLSKFYTFRSNIKSSLLKLLCTLLCLCEGNPFQPFGLNSFKIDFLSHICSQFPFLNFHGQAGQKNKGKGIQSPWVCSASQTSQPCKIAAPPISHLSTAKVIARSVQRAAGGMFPLHFSKWTHLVLPSLLPRRERKGRYIWQKGSDKENNSSGGNGHWV